MNLFFDFFRNEQDRDWTGYVQKYDTTPVFAPNRKKKINGHKRQKKGKKPPSPVEKLILIIFFIYIAWLLLKP